MAHRYRLTNTDNVLAKKAICGGAEKAASGPTNAAFFGLLSFDNVSKCNLGRSFGGSKPSFGGSKPPFGGSKPSFGGSKR